MRQPLLRCVNRQRFNSTYFFKARSTNLGSHCHIPPSPWQFAISCRRASTKLPVYFPRDEASLTQTQNANASVSTSIYDAKSALPGSPLMQPSKQKSSKTWWTLVIVYGSLGMSLYGFTGFIRKSLSNREELPSVDRIRYNFLSREELHLLMSAGALSDTSGLPSLELILGSNLVISRGSDDEVANMAYRTFDKLIKTNEIADLELHILAGTTQHQSSDTSKPGHLFIHRDSFNTDTTEASVAAYLAPLMAEMVLEHRQELVSFKYAMTHYVVPNTLLLLPVTAIYKLVAIFTIPFFGLVYALNNSELGIQEFLDEEAEGLALDFLHNTGNDVLDLLRSRMSELVTAGKELEQCLDSDRSTLAAEQNFEYALHWAKTCQDRVHYVASHLEERYPEELAKAGHEERELVAWYNGHGDEPVK